MKEKCASESELNERERYLWDQFRVRWIGAKRYFIKRSETGIAPIFTAHAVFLVRTRTEDITDYNSW